MKKHIQLAIVLALLAPTAAHALSITYDSTSTPYSGITIKTGHSSSPTRSFVVAFVSLCTSHVHVIATKPPKVRQTAGAWGASQGVQLAVNGDFFNYVVPPTVYGDAVGGGVHWPASLTGVNDTGGWYYRNYGWIAVGDGWVEFSHSEHVKTHAADFEKAGYTVSHGFEPKKVTTAIPPGTQALVSGFSELVIEGKVYTCPDPWKADKCFPDRGDMSSAALRTAMGITQDRKTMIFLVMKSATYGTELAQIMGKLGAWEAFNLDGGGSSTMWTAKNGTIFPTGTIRPVANHWGVYATTSKPAAPGSCFESGGCFPTTVPGSEGSDFADYPTSWLQYPYAKLLYDYGFDDGCGKAGGKPLYCPKCDLRRREAAVTLARAIGLDTSKPPATATFTDVPKSDPDFAEIEAIAKAGITSGCGTAKFCPDNTLTRGQAAKFLRKSAGWKVIPAGPPTFADVPANHVFFAEIETVAANCVTNGCGDGANFCPDELVRRDQFAAFVARTFDLENANKCLDYCDTTTCAGGPVCGAWSACGGFADQCDETGTKSRACTTYADCKPLSLDKKCGAKASTETAACTVDTDGKVVSGWGAWGACGGFDGACDETGTRARTRVVCAAGKTKTEFQDGACTVSTDGDVISGWTAYGPCVGDPCAGAGEKTRTRVVCTAGEPETQVEVAPCVPAGVCGVDAGPTDAGSADAADGGAADATKDGGAEPTDGSADGVVIPDSGAGGDTGLPRWKDSGPIQTDTADAPRGQPDSSKPRSPDSAGPGAPDVGAVTGDSGAADTPPTGGAPVPSPDTLASDGSGGSPSDGCSSAPSPPGLPLLLLLALLAWASRRRAQPGA